MQTPAEHRRRLVRRGIRPGQAAMTMEGTWLFPPMDNDFPDTQVRRGGAAAGRPAGQPRLHRSPTAWASIRRTRRPAWVLLQYLAGPEGMGKWTSLGLALPAREDVEPARRIARRTSPGWSTARRMRSPGLRRHPDRLQQRADRVLGTGGTGQEIADAAAAAAQ